MALAASGVVLIAASAAMAQQRNFVACPIVRDTKTVPCYLAEYRGELYFLGIQQDITSEFHPPQLKHEVLVEGVAPPDQGEDGPRVCGGIPLKPLSISVLREVNLACNTLLPAEPGIEAPAGLRGAGPSSRHAEAPSMAREVLTGAHEFTAHYAFDDDYLDFSANRVVTQAAEYAKRIGASAVKVSGYRATSLLSNGVVMEEKAGLAEKRAHNIETLLKGLGVQGVTVEWKSDAEPGDGRGDAARRRVSIDVNP